MNFIKSVDVASLQAPFIKLVSTKTTAKSSSSRHSNDATGTIKSQHNQTILFRVIPKCF